MERRKLACVVAAGAIALILLFAPIWRIHSFHTLIAPEGVGVNDAPFPQNVIVTARDEHGGIVGQWILHNNLTVPGVNDWMRHRLFNSSFTAGPACYIAIGTGSDDGNATNNSDLVNQIQCVEATPWIPGNMQFGLNATFTFSDSYTITEAGVKTGASGYLIFYVNDLNVSVDSSWTLEICWIITIQEA